MAKDKKDLKTSDFVDQDKTIYTAGQALAAQRKRVNKHCVVCDKEMINVYESADCCSSTCRSKKRRNAAKKG